MMAQWQWAAQWVQQEVVEFHWEFQDHEGWCQSLEGDCFSSSWWAPWWALGLQLMPLALDPLPEALDLDLEDLLLPEAQDLEEKEWNLSSSAVVTRRGPSTRQGQCLPWGCHLT